MHALTPSPFQFPNPQIRNSIPRPAAYFLAKLRYISKLYSLFREKVMPSKTE